MDEKPGLSHNELKGMLTFSAWVRKGASWACPSSFYPHSEDALGMFALCVAVVWATQEEQVALRSRGHRQITRGGPRNPWLKKLCRMTERVGTWLMKISRPQGEPSHGQGRRGTRTFATTMRREPGDREDIASRPRHSDSARIPWGYTSCGQSHPILDSGAVLSMFMDNVLVTGLPTRIHGDPPAALSKASEVPELITDEDLKTTPPYEERLSTSARTRLDRVRMEMVQGSHQ
ncbi:hypothetical protein K438DRAFT_1783375 [Mycena galopus ATCC 62051]|nr:hypothetical protein K438DRAFT_1783375 [Mycena galopus ATCC 62051]